MPPVDPSAPHSSADGPALGARERLLAERVALETRLASLAKDEAALNETLAGREQKTDITSGEPDTASVERGAVRTLRSGLEARLAELELALASVEDGSYGMCQGCGQPIPPERLAAIPGCTECVRCKGGAGRRR